MQKSETATMIVPIRKSLYEQVRQAAKEQDLSISAFVRLTLRRVVESKKESDYEEQKIKA